MTNICGKEFLSGPFDDCLECQYLGNGCSGPRTTCMPHDRYVEWLKALKKLRGYTNQKIADGTGLSLATVNDIFAGRRKTINRETAGLLEDFLIGGGKWPCAMQLVNGKEIVYEDRPETLEQLRVAREQIETIRSDFKIMRDSLDAEMQRVRGEYDADVTFYRERIDFLTDRIRNMDEMIKRKDDYIDRLAKKLGL